MVPCPRTVNQVANTVGSAENFVPHPHPGLARCLIDNHLEILRSTADTIDVNPDDSFS
jgi:hypothetical protein